jgi:hypothetical protein
MQRWEEKRADYPRKRLKILNIVPKLRSFVLQLRIPFGHLRRSLSLSLPQSEVLKSRLLYYLLTANPAVNLNLCARADQGCQLFH